MTRRARLVSLETFGDVGNLPELDPRDYGPCEPRGGLAKFEFGVAAACLALKSPTVHHVESLRLT